MLQHLARDLARLPVLVVCTYRDTDLVRTHPLSEALAGLNRDPGFQRIVLRGLSKEEVRTYIADTAGVMPASPVLERIVEETEGNPFFLGEVVNLLTQEGTLEKDSVSDIAVPDGVKEALGRRLDRLSEKANALLQVAAVVGREFTYDTLQLLHQGSDDALLALVEEGLAARVIEEMDRPGRYRFTHALMQETLLGELSTTRRVRLHGQVGEALERRWGGRAGEYASRLAHHFGESATLTEAHAEKARAYALLAAKDAEAKFAWPEAVRWYEAAVAELEEPEPDALTALARCYGRLEAWSSRADATLVRAVEGYRRRGDGRGLAHAVADATDSGTTANSPELHMQLVREALEVGEEVEPRTRLRLLRRLLEMSVGYNRRADLDAIEARIEALVDGLEEGRATWAQVEGTRAYRAGDFAGAAHSFRVAADGFLAIGQPFDAFDCLSRGTMAALTGGELGLAADNARAWFAFSSERHHAQGLYLAGLFLDTIALLRWQVGAIMDVERDGQDGLASATFMLADLEGRPEAGVGALAAAQRGTLLANATVDHHIQYLPKEVVGAFFTGDRDAASEWFAEWIALWSAGVGDAITRTEAFALVGHCLVDLATEEQCRAIWEEVRHWRHRCGYLSALATDPARGALALRLGLVEEAEQAFREGAEWAEHEGCPVEIGRNLQGLAAVAERRGDVPGALALLDRAAGQFQPRGVKLFLDQVVAAKVRLQGISSLDERSSIAAVSTVVTRERPSLADAIAPDGTVTLLFSDIEGSTELNEELGDTTWLEVLRAHNAIIDRAVAVHGGRTVKTMGDGYMVAFASPEAAVGCAMAIQAALASPAEPLRDIRVRVGIHMGSAVREGDDFFGREVNLAARVASAALGGEVLVSEAVRDRLAGSGAWQLGEAREVEMKGFASRQPVFRAQAH